MHEADIENEEEIKNIIFQEKPDKILHLAARAGVQPSLKDPLKYVRTNIIGTANVLEAARLAGVMNVVFASSSSVYGGNKKIPFSEKDNVDNPYSPYAATKRSCEILAANYKHIHGMHIAALRYFTVYGPRNRPDMAIYKFTEKILNDEPLKIYQTEQEIKRDWTYISDIVKGTIMILDKTEHIGFDIFNLGGENPVLLLDFVKHLETALEKKAQIIYTPLPPGDVPITCADTTKITNALKWKPTTPLEEGIKEFVKWFKEQNK